MLALQADIYGEIAAASVRSISHREQPMQPSAAWLRRIDNCSMLSWRYAWEQPIFSSNGAQIIATQRN